MNRHRRYASDSAVRRRTHTLLAGSRAIEFQGEFDRRGGRAQIEAVLEIGVTRGLERVHEDEISNFEVHSEAIRRAKRCRHERFLQVERADRILQGDRFITWELDRRVRVELASHFV